MADDQIIGMTTDGNVWHAVRHQDGSWVSFESVNLEAGKATQFSSVACAATATELHLVGTTNDGGMWHTIRRTDQPGSSWAPFGDVKGVCGNPGSFQSVACATFGWDLHVVGVTTDGIMYHTIRQSNTFWAPFGNVEVQIGYPDLFVTVGCTTLGGDLHVAATATDGSMFHTIRYYPSGAWQPFGNVKGPAGDPGSFSSVTAATLNGDLHVMGTTSDGGMWRTSRQSDGTWQRFGDVKGQAGNPGSFGSVGCGSTPSELHVVGTTQDGGIWYTIERGFGTWLQFSDLAAQAGQRGPFGRCSLVTTG